MCWNALLLQGPVGIHNNNRNFIGLPFRNVGLGPQRHCPRALKAFNASVYRGSAGVKKFLSGLGIFLPNNGTSRGREHGKSNGNWDYVAGYRD